MVSVLLGETDASAGRQRLSLDRDWMFRLGDPEGAAAVLTTAEIPNLQKLDPDQYSEEKRLEGTAVDPVAINLGGSLPWVGAVQPQAGWIHVDLPHDWLRTVAFSPTGTSDQGYRAFGPSYANTVGWYRRELAIPASWSGKSLTIEFDGVFRDSLVWLNGHCLGRHPSGYTGFNYDISAVARPGMSNTLVVRADASRSEGWFYEGAGIYRHVWLVAAPPVHVAHWGTFVRSEIGNGYAIVTTDTSVVNMLPTPAAATLTTHLADSDGQPRGEPVSTRVVIAPHGKAEIRQQFRVDSPRLWSTRDPQLYHAISLVVPEAGTADGYDTSFGIRSLKFTADNGFLLNGVKVILKGVCVHQDHGGVGTAVPDGLAIWRLQRLRELGCNALRTAHNPPSSEVLEACDRLGILVMDENRRFSDSKEGCSEVESMIRRDRNHPSVIIWSLGNEEMKMQGSILGATILTHLQDIAHSLDPTRPCTVAMNEDWGRGFSGVIDVQGFNYYRDSIGPDEFHKRFPSKPTVGTEEASTLGTRGEYITDPGHAHLPAYDSCVQAWASTAEAWWKFYASRPWMSGAFVWTGFDYHGETLPLYWPSVHAQYGILDICGFPKDNAYYYKAWWTTAPVLHLLPHWNWTGVDRRELLVTVHTHARRVRVSLNQRGSEYRPVKDGVATFSLRYYSGTLTVQTTSDDGHLNEERSFSLSETDSSVPLGHTSGEMVSTRVTTPKEVEVWAQTNCEEVELFLNGRSQGRRRVEPLGHAQWQVTYEPGTLEAKGYRDGRLVLTDKVETTGAPAAIRLTADRCRSFGDDGEIEIISAAIVDAEGRVVPYASNLITFNVLGGRILGVSNGDPDSHDSESGPLSRAFHGLAQVILRSESMSPLLQIRASSPGLTPATMPLSLESGSACSHVP